MLTEIKAPSRYVPDSKFSIFLAGSIDQGNAFDWQKYICASMNDYNVVLFNPRRDNWDNTLEQSLDNPIFVEQVTWEQYYLKLADYRIFVFTADSKAPITFFELGEFIDKPGIICCLDGFYRKANVQITAALHGKVVLNTLDELVSYLKVIITEKQWKIL